MLCSLVAGPRSGRGESCKRDGGAPSVLWRRDKIPINTRPAIVELRAQQKYIRRAGSRKYDSCGRRREYEKAGVGYVLRRCCLLLLLMNKKVGKLPSRGSFNKICSITSWPPRHWNSTKKSQSSFLTPAPTAQLEERGSANATDPYLVTCRPREPLQGVHGTSSRGEK